MDHQLPSNVSSAFMQSQLDTSVLRSQLLRQIEKDLELEPLVTPVERSAFFVELHQELISVLRHLIEHQPQRLPNIIYRVDLHELKVKRLLANTEIDAAASLAEEIVVREMKKVFYRNVYSGNIKI